MLDANGPVDGVAAEGDGIDFVPKVLQGAASEVGVPRRIFARTENRDGLHGEGSSGCQIIGGHKLIQNSECIIQNGSEERGKIYGTIVQEDH